MQKGASKIMRAFLFCLFVSTGLATITLSILVDDFLQMYTIRIELAEAEQTTKNLEKLINDYSVLIRQIETEPNILKRLGTVAFGTEPNEKGIAYPRATERQLAAAKQALSEQLQQKPKEPAIPEWTLRCLRPYTRISLFLLGSAMVIIAFVNFGSKETTSGC